ncbi:hypothetical protein PPTG_20680 [Phytophthora nicotianae INRA-310]|uniref:Uncharacterized protein n=1 Tax=Phytophthora nicotianae (strain INRA-310) TaxID=761204 RepID=W2RE22_PHYN3|nr:hypothetical protein PPTG_20680 [Phytophthora nicotianae INRA-310]ETN23642.1 hypothetical protein PPTG_20680 [Phytophthora nicotianae INRA-310]
MAILVWSTSNLSKPMAISSVVYITPAQADFTHDLSSLRASILRLRYSGHEIDFGPPDDALQTCLRTIEVRAPGLLAHDARQIPTAKGSGKLIKEERKEGD